MRSAFLISSILPSVLLVTGCSRGEPENAGRHPTMPATMQSPIASGQVAPDPWKTTVAELEQLIRAADDESDGEGRFVAISLHKKDVTLADLATCESAGRLERLNAHSGKLTDADMEHLAEFPGLKKLILNVNLGVTDDGLQYLSELRQLRYLSLFYCPQLTGSGFEHLKNLDDLVLLNIGNNKNVTDANLVYLRDLVSLQILIASPLQGLTDEGMKHIAEISGLRRLTLQSELVTDAGIKHLAALKQLDLLNLLGCTQLTDAGIDELQRALPDCRIVK